MEEIVMLISLWSNWKTFLIWTVLAGSVMGTRAATAQTYVSSEPIPSEEIVGAANLTKIRNIGYANLELWSRRLLNECRIVDNVITALSSNRAISTVMPGNTRYLVAAGGFEGVTNPTYVVTVQNSGQAGVSAADIFVLDNALGYVLNQSGTAQFSLPYDKRNPFEFSIDYAAVTYAGTLTGQQAKEFFDYVGTIDPALWSGTYAGFTQVNLSESPVTNYLMNNSMVFLIGAVPKRQFIQGLSTAAANPAANMTYSPLAKNGKPTTGTAGVAFPGNDWLAYPNGQGYLANLGNASTQLLNDLAALRQKHLQATTNLLNAINKGNVGVYLNNQFRCP
jgi:hypothetical protein